MPRSGRTAVATADPGEAVARFAAAFPGLRIDVERGSDLFRFTCSTVGTAGFSINRVRCSGRLHASGPLPDSIVVGRRTASAVTIRRGDREIDTTRPCLRPVASSEFDLRDGGVMLVTLQPGVVADCLERSGERGPLVSRLETTPHLAAWGLVMDHAATFLDGADQLDGRAADELQDLLC